MSKRGKRSLALVVSAVMLLDACSSTSIRAQRYSDQGEWMKSVIEYRKALAEDPSDVENKSRLIQAEWRAAEFYFQRGERLLAQGNIDGAISEFQQGLSAKPDHEKLRQAMNSALARKNADLFYREGLRLEEGGKKEDALRSYQNALQAYPEHPQAKEAAARLEAQILNEHGNDQLSLSSQAPITLNFRQAEIRSTFEFIAKSFGVDMIFDDSIKSVPVTLFAKNVSFEQALNLLLMTTKTFYKKIGTNTILISQDTKDKRDQYEDLLVRTFYLNNVKAKDMAETLKGMLTIKKMVIDEQLNTLLVRDSEDVMKLIEKIINVSDRKPAEVILEVEVLEVNRSKAERLGLDLGSYEIGASVPATPPILLSGSIRNQVRDSAVLTLPGATFRFFKQDVDGKTLANPKIRVLNGKVAKIHIGDRIPLRVSTVTEATGQVRTTYDYKEIGILLNVEPTINLDNSSTVKLTLEVSTLGENFGTAADPAYKIGTRNAETVMLLRDNETAILGGLIRDEDTKLKVGVPLIGDIPVLGDVLSSHDNTSGRTDVLLTITPRVVRGWDVAGNDERSFNSGTEDRYLTQSLYASLGKPALLNPALLNKVKNGNAGPDMLPENNTGPALLPPTGNKTSPGLPTAALPPTGSMSPVLEFGESMYQGAVDQEMELQIKTENLNLSGIQNASMDILFNPELMSFVSATTGDIKAQDIKASADSGKGVLHITLDFGAEAANQTAGSVARIIMRGVKPGISYLVYQGNEFKNLAGDTVVAQSRPSRVLIK
jgi:general secretion pathway protein D